MRREIHFWSDDLEAPPCGTVEDRIEWSGSIEDVTCEECREALAGDSGDLSSAEADADHHAGEPS
jgi:hypothetical protein